jgi:hypothetical protein
MNHATTYIYALCEPNTEVVRYVGKADNYEERYYHHLKESFRNDKQKKQRTHKNNWIKSLLIKGLKPTLILIDEVPEVEWKFWERHYISLFKSWGFRLVNKMDGGDGGRMPHDISQRTARKLMVPILQYSREGKFIREWDGTPLASKELKLSRSSISSVLSGATPTAKNFIFKHKTDNYPSQIEAVQADREKMPKVIAGHKKLSLLYKGKIPYSIIEKARIANTGRPSHRRRPIIQYDLLGNKIAEHASVTSAEKEVGVTKKYIFLVLKGKLDSIRDYRFKYKNVA